MSYNLYVYKMGIVDFYSGMMPLKDYIKLCDLNENEADHYLTCREIKRFLLRSFLEASLVGWEGDIRNLDEVAISAIPRPTAMPPYKMVVFKQDNNGTSFLVSETKIFINDDDKSEGMSFSLAKQQNCDYRDMHMTYLSCCDLVETLFDNAFNEVDNKEITKDFLLRSDEIIKRLSSSNEAIRKDLSSRNESKVDDKFNINNYETI